MTASRTELVLRPPRIKPAAVAPDCFRTGPGTLAGRYLRQHWLPVALSHRLPRGQAIAIRVLGEQLVLARDGAGVVRLGGYPTHERLGHVFAYLGAGERGAAGPSEPPPLPRYPDLDGPGVIEPRSPETLPCNYFQVLENLCDLAHVPFVHRHSITRAGMRLARTPPPLSAAETVYGLRMHAGEAEASSPTVHFLMPNAEIVRTRVWNSAALGGTPAQMTALVWVVPNDDTHATMFIVNHVAVTGAVAERYAAECGARRASEDFAPLAAVGDAILAGRFRLADVPSELGAHPLFPTRGLFRLEDYVAVAGQRPIPDWAAERLGQRDVGVRLLRRLWQRELRALAAGAPLTSWRTPCLFAEEA